MHIVKHNAPSPLFLGLREIASWHEIPEITEESEVCAGVPVLQRGLVWQPDQIEMLWDSILRGFPIGALVLSGKIAAQLKEEDAKRQGITHHLLDGQQRCNAIALGFKDPFPGAAAGNGARRADSILWLDLNPPSDARSTREFMARLTTPAHPWGYTRSDSAAPLSAGAIRESLKKIGVDPASDGYKRPSTYALSPQEAVVPVPLSWLLHGLREGDLWEVIKNRLERSPRLGWHGPLRAFLENEEGEQQRAKIYRAIKRAETMRIIALCAPEDLLGSSRQESVSSGDQWNLSNIEHLFQRLNQQGTPLDGEELAYSMIKAYWPELAGPIDRIAKQLPATRLISLGIRAALSEENRERLPNGLGVSGIRSMARRNDEKTDRVCRYVKDESSYGLGHGCKQIEAWLRYDISRNPSGVLPVHIGSIAQNSPDIFLLLLTFAKRPPSDWEQPGRDWPKRLQALATLAHWFGRNKGNIANSVFAACADRISLTAIQRALFEALREGDLRPIHAPANVDKFIMVAKDDLTNWAWDLLFRFHSDGKDDLDRELREKWEEFLWFRGEKELLLYAQREYLDRRFDYDPSRKDFWKGHNRPWDFDHILASYFLYYQQGAFKRVCSEWGGTIGNLRAWPFEDNRSDQAEVALEKCSGEGGVAKRLNSFLEPDELVGFSGGDTVRRDLEAAHAFVTACCKRLLRIYRTWYESVGVAELLPTAEDAASVLPEPSPASVA